MNFLNRYKTFFSPAKINLFFNVLKKREDGYHEIFSLNQTVSFFDKILIRLKKRDNFICPLNELKFENNLIFKAVDLFRKKTKSSFQVEIKLIKNIPIGGGLAGGSSNAATVLWALREILKKNISREDLMDWGKELGADVPFFFSKGSCICKGIGEKLFSSDEKKRKFIIANPNLRSSTEKVYQNVKIDKKNHGKIFFNDLEKSAFEIYPKLKQIKSKLYDIGFEKVSLSGSGSCFICLGSRKKNLDGIKFHSVETIFRDLNKWYCE